MRLVKKELKAYLALKKQLETESEQIRELESYAAYGNSGFGGVPGVKSWVKDKLGKNAAKLIDLERTHAETYQQLTLRIERVDRWLSSLPDSLYKSGLYWHYVKGLPWLRVQRKLGNLKSADALRVGADYLIMKYADKF